MGNIKKADQDAFEIMYEELAHPIPIRVKNNQEFKCNRPERNCDSTTFTMYVIQIEKQIYVVGKCKMCECVHVFARQGQAGHLYKKEK